MREERIRQESLQCGPHKTQHSVNYVVNEKRAHLTTFIMADSARVPDRVALKTRSESHSVASRPSSFVVVSTSNVSNPTFLTENDISGASLLGRKTEELKTLELKFWLKCRRDVGIRLKTKAELVKRVHDYIRP